MVCGGRHGLECVLGRRCVFNGFLDGWYFNPGMNCKTSERPRELNNLESRQRETCWDSARGTSLLAPSKISVSCGVSAPVIWFWRVLERFSLTELEGLGGVRFVREHGLVWFSW